MALDVDLTRLFVLFFFFFVSSWCLLEIETCMNSMSDDEYYLESGQFHSNTIHRGGIMHFVIMWDIVTITYS